jgi:hypothetical protein
MQALVGAIVALTPIQAVLNVAAYGLAAFASWYVGKNLVKWIQAYRSKQQAAETARLKDLSEAMVRRAQEESDKLKDIEGR